MSKYFSAIITKLIGIWAAIMAAGFYVANISF